MVRILASLILAGLAGAAALVAGYAARPGFTLEMDRAMPTRLTGFYEGERAGQETFAWSRREATMQLPGLDRRGAWTCVVRLRGGRADAKLLPTVTFTVDGIVTSRHDTGNDFSDISVPLPPRSGDGAVITLTTATFVPGGGDKRELGVYVDRWNCAPDAGFTPLPPGAAIRTAAIASAAFGGVLVAMGAPVVVLAAGVAAIAGLQAIPLTRDLGPFSAFALPLEWLALALTLGLWATVLLSRQMLGRPLSVGARVALFVTFGVLYLKLAALLHPSKLIVDALFHAHRLEWVLAGNYFFTQPMPSGVRFPYAIGLYVFTAPWTVFTADFVTLLRVVVTATEAAGGILLYRVISRYWGDRFVAAAATVLFALVPRTFNIVGNANLTNAFGQSVALAALIAATLWPLSRDRWRISAGLALLFAFALLCHISTFTLFGGIAGVLFLLYRFAARPPLKHEAWMLASALFVAAILSIVVYYGHFADAFQSALRVRATAPGDTATAGPGVSLATRVFDAARFSVMAVGWPLLLLAIPGTLAWIRRGWRDRLGLAIAALGIAFIAFTASVVVMPVEQAFYRYALEFISRVTLATYPVIVIWAALGAVWGWRTGGLARVATVAVFAAAIATAGDAWMEWLR